jgi:hypothetical protein
VGDGFARCCFASRASTCAPTYNYSIEASSNLFDWVSLVTNALPFTFTDTNRFDYQFCRGLYVP